MRRIGIFGGTFDPVHIGHLLIAEQIKEDAALDEVIFMPAGIQPFKQDVQVTSAEHRVAMLNLAVESNPQMSVTTIETEHGGVSYTIDSLRALANLFGDDAQIFFMIGADMFMNIELWKESDAFLSGVNIAVGHRPGTEAIMVAEKAAYYREKYNSRIQSVENTEFAVSSEDIRERVKDGRTIRYLVPKGVWDYIFENELYAQ